ncbi:MAG TPA: alkaline phosphatase family protein [Candidatus Eremiobacteraceae bacterium]
MLRKIKFAIPLCALVVLVSGCGGGNAPAAVPHGAGLQARSKALTLPQYVIVMVQENRTVDNLFQTQPGVDTRNFGIDSHNHRVPLKQVALGAPWGCSHAHSAFVTEVTKGFDLEPCGKNAPADAAFSYVDPSQITQYTALASQYAIADHVLQSNEGPSFPAHLYLIAATSGTPGSHWNISENDGGHPRTAAGCNAPPGKTVTTIDMTSAFPGIEDNPIFPCINPLTIFNELDSANISWKYYTPSVGSIWTAPYAVQSLYTNDKANVIVPETTVLSDIQNGTLAHVSYVIPSGDNSDHPGKGNNGGPTWVASVVNALGASQYWNQCEIIVVWDDWGGWYDHVAYRHPASSPDDPYEYGLRVPLLAIGPFAKSNWVGHEQRDFSAIPHFIEDVYGLNSLGQLDAQTDDLFQLFDFHGQPRKFTHIPTGNVTIKGLINRPPDLSDVDDD